MARDSTTTGDEEEFHFLFPYRLHRVLSLVERQGLTNVVSWLSCGTAFKVHDVGLFEEIVLPKIGKLSSYKSFRRQLNIYRFKRITVAGSWKAGAYEHPFFRRDHVGLCRGVLRGQMMTTGKSHLKQHSYAPHQGNTTSAASKRREGEKMMAPSTNDVSKNGSRLGAKGLPSSKPSAVWTHALAQACLSEDHSSFLSTKASQTASTSPTEIRSCKGFASRLAPDLSPSPFGCALAAASDITSMVANGVAEEASVRSRAHVRDCQPCAYRIEILDEIIATFAGQPSSAL